MNPNLALFLWVLGITAASLVCLAFNEMYKGN